MLFFLFGCGGESAVAPLLSIAVTAKTEGEVIDADGYTVQVGDIPAVSVGANNAVIISGLQAGQQSVALSGIAPNCAVLGANPQTVLLQSGQSANVTFTVRCTAPPVGDYRIAFMTTTFRCTEYGDPWEISSRNSDGSVIRLTDNSVFDGYPSWSPDGQKIAFVSERDGNREIYQMTDNGSNVMRLTDATTAVDLHPNWSPDGTKILFESNRDGDIEVFVMNVDGSNVTQLTSNTVQDRAPRFSPDGRKVVFITDRDAPSTHSPYSGWFGHWEVYEMNADGTGAKRLTNDGAVAGSPSYFQDGTKILFHSDRGGVRDIYVMSTDGSGISRLTGPAGTGTISSGSHPVASPDNRQIMYHHASRLTVRTFVMNPDGSGIRGLDSPGCGDGSASWTLRNLGYSYTK